MTCQLLLLPDTDYESIGRVARPACPYRTSIMYLKNICDGNTYRESPLAAGFQRPSDSNFSMGTSFALLQSFRFSVARIPNVTSSRPSARSRDRSAV